MIQDVCVVAFDTETSGAWPITSEVVEFGAVKWKNGQYLGEMNVLIKPSQPLTESNIAIHGITNEMLEDKLKFSSHARAIADFLQDADYCIAHHAPFDMGFIAFELERASVFPQLPNALCTSLLSRKLVVGSENHKLQTLIKHFNIFSERAHRAQDDAQACLEIFFKCVELYEQKYGKVSGAALEAHQEKTLMWNNYRLLTASSYMIPQLYHAIVARKPIEIVYDAGLLKGKVRPVFPIGLVRSPDGDYLYAKCLIENANKRFYINKISDMG